ncbi:M20 aminoacylase family protein [Kosakonia sp. BK9b]|uniref:M20 aminoacylase family protein n=1 Tax=Kosakonia sp. TaxID=1916651 RepID=UPI0028A06DC9|nr:M20 aminoacylase family protein [Kosakonia sp.]
MFDKKTINLDVKQLIEFRRDLHMHPELKFEEHRTADKISARLTALDIPHERGLATTGIVATLYGRHRSAENPGPALGIRADIDALPMQETNQLAYASQHPGRMHACGHDGHTAMLLGAAELLSQDRDFDGTVHLIFQPGEEGGAGARIMMDEGLFTHFPCQAVFALHNWPDLPQGKMGVRSGPIMASGVTFEIIVRGKGGHAALPHSTIDPVPIACSIVSQLQSLVARSIDPLDSVVLTIGKIEAGTSPNIIPAEAKIYGTCRTLTSASQTFLLDGVKRISRHIAEAHFAQAEVLINSGGYPNTTNHPKEARFMARIMRDVVGDANADSNVLPAMTAEDFGFMLQEVPGAYGWIGNGESDAASSGKALHSTAYDFNDNNLALGAVFWDRLARNWFLTEAQR